MSSRGEETHSCVVCGVDATRRCSKCFHKGGKLELFFCSEECQATVWYAHKRVCGKSLHPAPWPWLSREEYDEALANRYVKIRYFGKMQSLNEYLWDVTRNTCTESHVPQHLRDFTHGHPHPFSPLVSQAALNDIRGFEMCRKLQSPAGITIASCDLMNLARAFAEQFVIGTPFPAPWYSSFMHRVIILMAAVQQVHVADDRAKGLERSRGACRAFEHDCMTEAGLGIAGEGLTAARFLFHLMLDQETMTLDSLFDMQRRWIDPPAR
ncbi:hypothetical protein JCM8115_002846 [Rhodotorula mucilaginosa]